MAGITGAHKAKGMESPVFESGDDTWAPSGAAFAGESDFYVGGLAGEELMRFDVETDDMDVVLETDDDNLYVLTNNTDGRGNPEDLDDMLLILPVE
ncbi:hypothetical protein HNR44_001521 [Geomicrobium halophilum]|uniref:DUF4394 domain-containing protein n=1 Tax=Geomicrobium halophilum TaxID=549000 RepID=A0A841PYS2_9BACL|nr:PQQ-dependent sugar dehydrogenase [Geomicrobium halophilum]MBB6449572.1 hypothetical protein [Geomicrobium halophilum]